MDTLPLSRTCESCPQRFVCHCLGVTEEALVEALTQMGLRSIHEIRACTGAGDGCTACHRHLKQYLETYAPAPAPVPGRLPMPVLT